MAHNESFDIAGPAGRLEAILMRPEGNPVAAAVVCHAHPLHGGMMHLKVVFRAAKALQRHGVAALRFNFRGVGRSEGVHDDGRGEQDDVRAALDEMEWCRKPTLFVQGERDDFGDGASLAGLVARLPEPRLLVVIPGSDHFFAGHLDRLQEAVGSWAAGRPWEAS